MKYKPCAWLDAGCESTANQSPRYDAEPWRAADRRKRKPLRKLKPRPERMPAQFIRSVFVKKWIFGPVAQLAAHLLCKQGVLRVRVSSGPPHGPTKAPGIVTRYTTIVAG